MRFSDNETKIVAWVISVAAHSFLLCLGFPELYKQNIIERVYRIPIQMVMVQEAPSKKIVPKATPKQKSVAKKGRARAKERLKKRLPGDRDQPVVTDRILPVYPKVALNNEWEGTVVVEVVIAVSGAIKEVRVVQSSGHDVLDHTFVRTLKEYYRFLPKRVSGKEVVGRRQLSYSFTL